MYPFKINYEDQGVSESEAQALYDLEKLGKVPLIKMENKYLTDFLEGRFPIRDLDDIDINDQTKTRLKSYIYQHINHFTQDKGFRNLDYFIYLMQLEIEHRLKLNFYRDDDTYFESLFALNERGKIRMICYAFLYERNVYKIPNSVLELNDLVILNLRTNIIHGIPKNIRKLDGLKYLDLSWNPLTDKIETLSYIFNLTNLEYLNLAATDLTEIPEEIGNLVNLKRLDLSDNKFTTLPLSMKNLTALESLIISNKVLKNLPSELKFLQSFKKSNF